MNWEESLTHFFAKFTKDPNVQHRVLRLDYLERKRQCMVGSCNVFAFSKRNLFFGKNVLKPSLDTAGVKYLSRIVSAGRS